MNLAHLLNPDLVTLLRAVAAQANDNDGIHGVFIVGGFVRDLMFGKEDIDMDVDIVVEGDAIALVYALVARYGGGIDAHIPFGTATWRFDGQVETALGITQDKLPTFIDFATTRIEHYAYPAALPTVTPIPEPGALARDALRRDFTINTLAIQLSPSPFGEFVDVLDGKYDLDTEIIRALHHQSFVDDPTRIFRAARFEQRYDFKIEPYTASLIPDALQYIDALTGDRLRHEIDLILNEEQPEKSFRRLTALGALRYTTLVFDEWTASGFVQAREFFANPPFDPGTVGLSTVCWAILGCRANDHQQLAARLQLERGTTHAIRDLQHVIRVFPTLEIARPSTVHAVLRGLCEDALVAACVIAPAGPVKAKLMDYMRTWRHTKPTINGNDLISMGLRRGPLFGKLLGRLRDAYLDGEITDADQERAFLQELLKHEGK
jgi:tRNA nucleotidyltransferase (CCA-adding enzyme)